MLDDTQVLSILEKMIKQRKESVTLFLAGKRQDLADKESAEIALIQTYMPAALGDAEIEALIGAAIATSGATTIKDMGKVMALIKSQVAGRADMGAVGAKIKARLGG